MTAAGCGPGAVGTMTVPASSASPTSNVICSSRNRRDRASSTASRRREVGAARRGTRSRCRHRRCRRSLATGYARITRSPREQHHGFAEVGLGKLRQQDAARGRLYQPASSDTARVGSAPITGSGDPSTTGMPSLKPRPGLDPEPAAAREGRPTLRRPGRRGDDSGRVSRRSRFRRDRPHGHPPSRWCIGGEGEKRHRTARVSGHPPSSGGGLRPAPDQLQVWQANPASCSAVSVSARLREQGGFTPRTGEVVTAR